MESTNYNQFGGSDIESNPSGRKMILQRVMQGKVAFLLYSVLVFVLLILLLVTGLKFSQINREIADVQLNLKSLQKFVTSAQAASATPHANHGHYNEFEVPVKGPCEKGWTFFDSSCYMISKDKADWTRAEEKCIALKAHLLVLNSEEELDYISNLLLTFESYWIGLVEREKEDHWTWVDGTDFNSTPDFWDQGQPDNWDYRVNGEDCGQLHASVERRRKLWNDADCTLAFHYVCEANGK